MPGLDHSGPRGEGSRTGRGLGKCNSPQKRREIAESQDQFIGRHENECRRGRGRGFGRRNRSF